jgi:hypothetical protein
MAVLSRLRIVGALSVNALAFAPALAEPVAVTVRVISQDAKFIGDSTGGARVTLRDAATGRMLAQGVTTGGTGDTERIMKASGRSPLRAGPDAAGFAATIDIDSPTLVDLLVEGPLSRPGSLIKVASQRWIMPGEPVTAGDGWTVELPGLAITPEVTVNGRSIRVAAKVEPMCGCPITPGGLWDAGDYRVSASLWRGKLRSGDAELAFARSPGHYEGDVAAMTPGTYTLVLFARNTKTGNSGMAQTEVRIR